MSEVEIANFLNWLTERARAQPDTPMGNRISIKLSQLGARIEAHGQLFDEGLSSEDQRNMELLRRKMQMEHDTHTVLT